MPTAPSRPPVVSSDVLVREVGAVEEVSRRSKLNAPTPTVPAVTAWITPSRTSTPSMTKLIFRAALLFLRWVSSSMTSFVRAHACERESPP
ncbi:hypothetical protein A6A25_39985 [Saccharothrix sp. CB00851]|nr:hypothetical protein A6A25_39985 [Saccharothrix sp. CB00851]